MAETLWGRLLEATVRALAHALLRREDSPTPRAVSKPQESTPEKLTRSSPAQHEVASYTRTHPSGKVVEVKAYQRGSD